MKLPKLPIFKKLRELGGQLNDHGVFIFKSNDAQTAKELIKEEFPEAEFVHHYYEIQKQSTLFLKN